MREWLPDVINALEPFMSDEDIESGARWTSTIAEQLAACRYGIICATPENIERPWLLFESGALAKTLDARVAPYMFGFPNLSLGDSPLSQFQAKQATKEDTLRLVTDINASMKEAAPLEQARLVRAFERAWPDLDERLSKITAPAEHTPAPDSALVMNEVLSLVRSLAGEMEEVRKELRRKNSPSLAEVAGRFPVMRRNYVFADELPILEDLCAAIGVSPADLRARIADGTLDAANLLDLAATLRNRVAHPRAADDASSALAPNAEKKETK